MFLQTSKWTYSQFSVSASTEMCARVILEEVTNAGVNPGKYVLMMQKFLKGLSYQKATSKTNVCISFRFINDTRIDKNGF